MSAVFDDEENRWTVRTTIKKTEDQEEGGEVFKVKFLLLNVGFAAKRHIPDFKGLDSFEGVWLHPSYWPADGIDLAGKRVAVIGTGATGVQLAQELSKTAAHLTVFQRTPNLAIPMGQKQYFENTTTTTNGHGEGREEQKKKKNDDVYPSLLYAERTSCFGGFDYNFLPRLTFDGTPEKRRATYEELWQHGDFHYWLATYADMLADPHANAEAYAFWREKTAPRIADPALREKLVPEVQPHAFGCKRISLENGYFEVFNRENVRLVDVKETPIVEVTPKGIRTAAAATTTVSTNGNGAVAHGDGGAVTNGSGVGAGEEHHDFDCIVLATGYDALTSGITQIDLRRRSGPFINGTVAKGGNESIKEQWVRDGARTYLGLSVAGFPNMFFTYGPQAPTAFCNGPTCAEMQGDWIAGMLRHMREKGLERVEVRRQSEEDWVQMVEEIAGKTLLPRTKSWYMGDNIPGKKRQPLLLLGGVPMYYERLRGCTAEGYAGFQFE